jgi:hypothetical protein
MLETDIVMSYLIFCLVLTLVLRLTQLLMICLIFLMDLTIVHIVLLHERIALFQDVLVTTHTLIVVIIFRVGMVFPLESFTPTLSPDTWSIHVFPIVVHVPLVQRVRCKRLLRPPQVAWLSAGFPRFISLIQALSHRPLLILCR